MGPNNMQSQLQKNLPPPISGTPIKPQLSFDEVDDDLYFRRDRNADALQSLSNSNIMWSHSGIAYELGSTTASNKSTASIVSKENIRKKLDVFLYSIDRRIKFTI